MKVNQRDLYLAVVLFSAAAAPAQASILYFTNVETLTSSGAGSVSVFEPNGYTAYSNNSELTEANSAFANLNNSSLGIKSSGTMSAGDSLNPVFTVAQLADTITATGPTTGLQLGVDLTVEGNSVYSDPTQGFTALLVAAFAPGALDNSLTQPTTIFGEAFILGSGTLDPSSYFAYQSLTYAGSYGTGPQSIPLNIPFSTLGSNFILSFGLVNEISVTAPAGTTWNVDYYDPLQVSLVAPAGVTLTSASGVLAGTTAATPEPGTIATLAGGLLVLGIAFRRKMKSGRL
jgi:hypothetical protein